MSLLSNEMEKSIRTEIITIFTDIQELMSKEDVRYLRASEAAKYCSVSPQTLKRWVALGLPEATIGRTVLFDKKDLNEFISKNKV